MKRLPYFCAKSQLQQGRTKSHDQHVARSLQRWQKRLVTGPGGPVGIAFDPGVDGRNAATGFGVLLQLQLSGFYVREKFSRTRLSERNWALNTVCSQPRYLSAKPAMKPVGDLAFELLDEKGILLYLGARFFGRLEPGLTRTCSKVVLTKFAKQLVMKNEPANERSVLGKAFYHFIHIKTCSHRA